MPPWPAAKPGASGSFLPPERRGVGYRGNADGWTGGQRQAIQAMSGEADPDLARIPRAARPIFAALGDGNRLRLLTLDCPPTANVDRASEQWPRL